MSHIREEIENNASECGIRQFAWIVGMHWLVPFEETLPQRILWHQSAQDLGKVRTGGGKIRKFGV